MLALIGMGLDTNDVSIKALDFIKKSDSVLYDGYTSIISMQAVDFIEEITGKKARRLGRRELEDGIRDTIEPARGSNVAILVIGDPLIATTHHIILQEARRLGIETAVYHSSSVFSAAVGESGLDIYKFGPTTTIPYWSKNYRPVSFLDVISKNTERGQHTLVLLDIRQDSGEPMKVEEAAEILRNALVLSAQKSFNGNTEIIVLGALGTPAQKIVRTKVSGLSLAGSIFLGKPVCIAVPGKTSFAEDEAMAGFAKI